jgi:hypothetical protein
LWDEAAHTVWVTNGARVFGYTNTINPATTPNGKPQVEFFTPAD